MATPEKKHYVDPELWEMARRKALHLSKVLNGLPDSETKRSAIRAFQDLCMYAGDAADTRL